MRNEEKDTQSERRRNEDRRKMATKRLWNYVC